jgi:hypothetical protein
MGGLAGRFQYCPPGGRLAPLRLHGHHPHWCLGQGLYTPPAKSQPWGRANFLNSHLFVASGRSSTCSVPQFPPLKGLIAELQLPLPSLVLGRA